MPADSRRWKQGDGLTQWQLLRKHSRKVTQMARTDPTSEAWSQMPGCVSPGGIFRKIKIREKKKKRASCLLAPTHQLLSYASWQDARRYYFQCFAVPGSLCWRDRYSDLYQNFMVIFTALVSPFRVLGSLFQSANVFIPTVPWKDERWKQQPWKPCGWLCLFFYLLILKPNSKPWSFVSCKYILSLQWN